MDDCGIILEIGSKPLLADRIRRRASAAGKDIVTLPRSGGAPFHAVVVAGETVFRMPRPDVGPLRRMMDETLEILRRLKALGRSPSAAIDLIA